MSIGILAILSIIATSFAINMRMEQEVALNYARSVKAKYIAEAGINKAIAELKSDAKTNFTYNEDSVNSGSYSDVSLYDGYGSYSVTIEDEQRKVNINYANKELLGGLLGDDAKADAVISYRETNGLFKTIDEIKSVTEIAEATYNKIKDDITVYSYLDLNTIDDTGADEPRCPVNINTASDGVLKAVLSPLGVSDSDIDVIKGKRPFSNWQQFDDAMEGLSVSDGTKDNIKNNCNPNRQKPSVYTTDFCFFSGGKYTITSTGILYDSSAKTKKIAEKKIKTVVDIYGILNQTKKSQFQGEEGDTTPVAFKVNTYDSCPVEPINSSNSWSKSNRGNYKEVHDSIKNGFWDNMTDTYDDDKSMFYLDGVWYTASTSNRDYLWYRLGDNYEIIDADGDGNKELTFIAPYIAFNGFIPFPQVLLGDKDNLAPDLIWDNFAWRTKFSDRFSPKEKTQKHQNDPCCTPPAITYWEHYVLWHMSRWKGEDALDRSCMKQLYNVSPDTGQLDTITRNVGNNIFWKEEQSGPIPGAYYVTSTFIVVSSGANYYSYAYKANGSTQLQLYKPITEISSANTSGQIGWQDLGGMIEEDERAWVRDVRIIPGNGPNSDPAAIPHFESTAMPVDASLGDVYWATFGATVTLSERGNPESERVYFQTSIDGGATWTDFPGILPGNTVVSSQKSSSIRYRANFTTLDNPNDNPVSDTESDPYYSETMALEDVTITYLLPETKMIYYREVLSD